MLRLHVVTEKIINLGAQYFAFWFIQTLKFCKSFLKPFLASVIKFFSSYKKFCQAVFKRRSCNSIFFFFLIFFPHISKTTSFDSKKHICWGLSTTSIQLFFYSRFSSLTKHVAYIRQQNLHKHRSISSMIIFAILQYFSSNAAKTLKKLKAHTLEPQTAEVFGHLETA